MTILGALTAKFKKIYDRSDGELFFAPGRVNLIGEHTDYNGGYVLSCAIGPGAYALAARRDDRMVHLHSLNYADRGVIEADLPSLYRLREYDWAIYPLGVMDALKKNGRDLTGADIVFCGDLPVGIGLASSAALEVLTAVILNDLFRLNLGPVDLALLAQRAENNFVGTPGGPADQLVVALGRKDQALLLNCATIDHQPVPLKLPGCSLIISQANQRREPAGSLYNERRAECEAALAFIQTRRAVNALCDLTPADFLTLAPVLTNQVHLKRVRHVITENQRALDAAEALRAGDAELFGWLMTQSHVSLRDDYQASGPEPDILVELALGCPGVLGSRLTGTGCGSLTLIKDEFMDHFKAVTAEGYEKAFGQVPAFYPAIPSDGARRVEAI